MEWFATGMLVAMSSVVAFVVWRRWIAPWKQLEELANTVVNKRPPRQFLIRGNPSSRNIGLAFESLVERQRDLEERFRQGEFSVQAVFGAMLDGLVVVEETRRVSMTSREF